MKKVVLIILASVSCLGLWSQGVLSISPGASITSRDGAFLVLNSTQLVNNGFLQQAAGDGTIKFMGNTSVNIGGTALAQMGKVQLSLDPGSSLSLLHNAKVESQIIFEGGMLNLNDAILDLGSTGLLINENEVSRAFTFGTGYIRAEGILNIPESVNIGNLGAVISSRRNMGLTVIKRGHVVQSNVNGSTPSILRYYDIEPTHNIALKATLKFYYLDAELNGFTEASLQQWKTKNNVEWELVGADETNMVSNYVLRNNISKFSRWTLSGQTQNLFVNNSILARGDNSQQVSTDVAFIVNAWPNPFGTEFNLNIGSTDHQTPVMLRVFSVTGQLIEQISNQESGKTCKVGKEYKPGMYIVQITQGLNYKSLKLIKQ